MKKKILCTLLSACILFGLVGCNEGGSGSLSSTSGSSSTGTSAGEELKYPERQVEIYVPYSAGGVNDLVARQVADYLTKEWGEPVVVINKSGSTATAKEVFAMEPDGYTALIMSIAEIGASTASNDVPPFDYKNDVTYLARLAKFPISFTVKGDAPWNDFKEFSDWAVENPSEVTWCAVGMTSPSAFQVAEWMKAIGADFTQSRLIASKGSSDGATKVAGGHAVLNTGDITAAKSMIDAGKLKSLAISPFEHEYFDVPLASDYVSGLTLGNGVGLMMPAGVPEEIVEKWNTTLEKMQSDPDFLAGMESISVMTGYMPSDEFQAFVEEDVATYIKLADEFNLKK